MIHFWWIFAVFCYSYVILPQTWIIKNKIRIYKVKIIITMILINIKSQLFKTIEYSVHCSGMEEFIHKTGL